jgi:hypothetical protein
LSYRGTSAGDIIPLSGEIVKFTVLVFRFYLYRRNLEDLIDWVFRILYENADEEQDRNDLRGIVEDCMSGWPYLEGGISEVLDALARPSGSLPPTLR